MSNTIFNGLNNQEYDPFTIKTTSTEIVQISGIVTADDIRKSYDGKKKPTTRNIKIKKKANK